MGFVSQRSRGYSNGFDDAFLGHARRYRLQRFVSLISLVGSKRLTPEEEYIAGYETGHKHGLEARNGFLEFTGQLPRDMSDWWWKNRETGARKALAAFRGEPAEPDSVEYSETYARLKEYLASRRILRALEEAKQFFHRVKDVDAFSRCVRLLDRLHANRTAVKRSEIPADAAKAEWKAIAQSAADLIDELRPADSATRVPLFTETTFLAADRTRTYSSAAAYVTSKAEEIRNVIVENWRIPQTEIPGAYAEMVNRIVRWFNNFSATEFDDALALLRNVCVLSVDDVDALIDSISYEVRRLFCNDLSRVVFCALGSNGGSSGSQFLYLLRQKLSIPEGHFPLDYHRLRHGVESIVFVDDIIGSGNQARRFCDQHLRDVVATKYYCSLVAFRRGLDALRAYSGFKFVFAAKILEESARAFSAESRMFGDETSRLRVRGMAERYGHVLYPKGPLGYDDGQAMIVFPHNTPNNTLPIIWASARNEKAVGVPWNPLWERRKTTIQFS